MRVYDQNLNGTAASRTGGAQDIQRSDGAAGRRVTGRSDSDRVELSNTLNTLSRALGADRSGRASRVAELAAQYNRGEYRADSAATARGMLTEALAAG